MQGTEQDYFKIMHINARNIKGLLIKGINRFISLIIHAIIVLVFWGLLRFGNVNYFEGYNYHFLNRINGKRRDFALFYCKHITGFNLNNDLSYFEDTCKVLTVENEYAAISIINRPPLAHFFEIL